MCKRWNIDPRWSEKETSHYGGSKLKKKKKKKSLSSVPLAVAYVLMKSSVPKLNFDGGTHSHEELAVAAGADLQKFLSNFTNKILTA